MIDWEAFNRQEIKFISALLQPPPSKAEVISAVWGSISDVFDVACTVEGRLHVAVDGLEDMLMFERLVYGDTTVVECEGVIVSRY